MATRERRRVKDFLDLPYAIAVARGEDGWTARVEELEGCEATGASPDEAAAAVRAAMGDWIGAALAAGRPVPTPRATATHSGRLLVRMRPDLHAAPAPPADRTRLLSLALKANLVIVVVAAVVAVGLLVLAWQGA